MAYKPGALIKLLSFAAICLLGLGSAPSWADEAQEIGVVGSAHGVAMGVIAGHAQALKTGDAVYLNETVRTGQDAAVQLMFLDKSSLTVTPGSEVKVDTFVYNPATSLGKMSLQGVKGAFRFIGGALSKQDYVTIKTPVSTIGIRGGIVQANIMDGGNKTDAIFFYGHEMAVWNNKGVQTSGVYTYGQGVTIWNNGAVQNLTPEEINSHVHTFNGFAHAGVNTPAAGAQPNTAHGSSSLSGENGTASNTFNEVAAGSILQKNSGSTTDTVSGPGPGSGPGATPDMYVGTSTEWGQWAQGAYTAFVDSAGTDLTPQSVPLLASSDGITLNPLTSNLGNITDITDTKAQSLGVVYYGGTPHNVYGSVNGTNQYGMFSAKVDFANRTLDNITITLGSFDLSASGSDIGNLPLSGHDGSSTNTIVTSQVGVPSPNAGQKSIVSLQLFGPNAELMTGTFNAYSASGGQAHGALVGGKQ